MEWNVRVVRANGTVYEVEVTDAAGGRKRRYKVTVSPETHERLTQGRKSREALVQAAFRFLLDREPPGSILSAFDIEGIKRYFPEFESEIKRYLDNN